MAVAKREREGLKVGERGKGGQEYPVPAIK